MVDDIVNLWTNISKWLPIIFHTWVTEYCKKDENCSQHRPEYWQIKYFVKLAKKHKNASIVIWHSGLFQVDEVIDNLSIYENVSVDTSFQWEEKIKELLFTFWVERLHFASDWPYWDRIPAVNVMLDTLSKIHSSIYSDERMKELIFRDNALRSMKIK
jgi:predicted TIM-barrel fold metal-dependent hydrolase